MAKPNYSFQKRQRELAKKQKKEQKMQQKLAGKAKPDEGLTPTPGEDEAQPFGQPGVGEAGDEVVGAVRAGGDDPSDPVVDLLDLVGPRGARRPLAVRQVRRVADHAHVDQRQGAGVEVAHDGGQLER